MIALYRTVESQSKPISSSPSCVNCNVNCVKLYPESSAQSVRDRLLEIWL